MPTLTMLLRLTNVRLRSELAMFDLSFFEEVEDLKYSYTKLKREAETLARGKVWNSLTWTPADPTNSPFWKLKTRDRFST